MVPIPFLLRQTVPYEDVVAAVADEIRMGTRPEPRELTPRDETD